MTSKFDPPKRNAASPDTPDPEMLALTLHTDDFDIVDGVFKKYHGHAEIVVVPEGVIRLNARLFQNHYEIQQILLPTTLIKIGKCAFSGCSGLDNLQLPHGLLEIGESAFEDCLGLTHITLPETVQRLGKGVFSRCDHLQTAILPQNLKKIPTFTFESCGSLKTVQWPKNPQIEPFIFAKCFNMDLAWEYYQVQDGICRRILGDIFELCPHGELLTDILVLRKTYFKILTLISVSAELDDERRECRLQIFQIFMTVAHILTQGNPCTLFWAARASILHIWQHYMDVTSLTEDIKREILRHILTEIGGTGTHVHLRDIALYQEYLRTPSYAAENYHDVMTQLDVENADLKSSSLRYHPQHWHHIAWLEHDQEGDYWTFATCMDGLFQNIDGARHMHYMIPKPEGGYEAWLAAWSKALYEHDFGILEIRLPTASAPHKPRLFFAIEQRPCFDLFFEHLKSLGISDVVHYWYNDKDLCTDTEPAFTLVP